MNMMVEATVGLCWIRAFGWPGLQQGGKDCQEFCFTKSVQVRQSRHSPLVKAFSFVRMKLSTANPAILGDKTRIVNNHWLLITSSITWTLNTDFNTGIPKMTACVRLSAVFQHCVSFLQPSSKYLKMSQGSLFHGGKCKKGEERDTMIDIIPCSDFQMSALDIFKVCAKAWVKHKPHVPFHPQICIVLCTNNHIFSNKVSPGTDNQVYCKLSRFNQTQNYLYTQQLGLASDKYFQMWQIHDISVTLNL